MKKCQFINHICELGVCTCILPSTHIAKMTQHLPSAKTVHPKVNSKHGSKSVLQTIYSQVIAVNLCIWKIVQCAGFRFEDICSLTLHITSSPRTIFSSFTTSSTIPRSHFIIILGVRFRAGQVLNTPKFITFEGTCRKCLISWKLRSSCPEFGSSPI